MDYDVIVVGAGLAGLTAASRLARERHRVLLLDRESFGGQAGNVEWLEDYPVGGEKVSGPALASQLVEQAVASGVQMELGEVIELESYSGCKSVTCADGKAYTAPVVLLAGGRHPRKLGVPGEDRLQGKGVIHCAFCDAGLYTDRVVAVCGAGDAGTMEALHLAKFASRVYLIESQERASAAAKLQERVRANARIELRCGEKLVAIHGDDAVSGVEMESTASGRRQTLEVYGVLIQAGFEPATGYLVDVPLDERGYVTDASDIPAAGDIRSGSPRTAAAAIRDGEAVAARAHEILAALNT